MDQTPNKQKNSLQGAKSPGLNNPNQTGTLSARKHLVTQNKSLTARKQASQMFQQPTMEKQSARKVLNKTKTMKFENSLNSHRSSIEQRKEIWGTKVHEVLNLNQQAQNTTNQSEFSQKKSTTPTRSSKQSSKKDQSKVIDQNQSLHSIRSAQLLSIRQNGAKTARPVTSSSVTFQNVFNQLDEGQKKLDESLDQAKAGDINYASDSQQSKTKDSQVTNPGNQDILSLSSTIAKRMSTASMKSQKRQYQQNNFIKAFVILTFSVKNICFRAIQDHGNDKKEIQLIQSKLKRAFKLLRRYQRQHAFQKWMKCVFRRDILMQKRTQALMNLHLRHAFVQWRENTETLEDIAISPRERENSLPNFTHQQFMTQNQIHQQTIYQTTMFDQQSGTNNTDMMSQTVVSSDGESDQRPFASPTKISKLKYNQSAAKANAQRYSAGGTFHPTSQLHQNIQGELQYQDLLTQSVKTGRNQGLINDDDQQMFDMQSNKSNKSFGVGKAKLSQQMPQKK